MNDTDIAKWLFMTTGNVESFNLDGSGDYTDENGNTITLFSDGSGEYRGVDGSWADFNSDGSGSYYGADGSHGDLYSDGSGSYYGADGSHGDLYSDGSGSYYGADGSHGDLYSDGSGSYHGADGNWNDWNVNDYDNGECNDDNSSYSNSLGDTLLSAALGVAVAKAIANDRKSNDDYDGYDDDNSYGYESGRQIAGKKEKAEFNWKGLIAFLIIISLFGLGLFIYGEYSKRTTVGVSADDLIGMDYFEVEQILWEKGFSNINASAEYDIDVNHLELEDTLISISIESNDHFKAKDWFLKESPILIKYHSIREIKVPISAKEAKKSNYKKVKKKLEAAGFVNITTKAKKDLIFGWLNKVDVIDTISIDDDTKFEKNRYYRPDSEIVIVYHAYKDKK